MAKYTSHYPALMFYVEGKLKRFASGEYVTDDKDEIAVLDALTDAKRVDEPKTQTQTEAKAPTKAPAKRTASAK